MTPIRRAVFFTEEDYYLYLSAYILSFFQPSIYSTNTSKIHLRWWLTITTQVKGRLK